jgi:hypothetical protein
MDSMAIAMIVSQQAQRAAWSDSPHSAVDVEANGAVTPTRRARGSGPRRWALALGFRPYAAH